MINIVINGKMIRYAGQTISFSDVIKMIAPDELTESYNNAVVYYWYPDESQQFAMTLGATINVIDSMVFSLRH